MSVIVAVKHNGAVYMGADSQTTYGNEVKKNSVIESERKITKLNNGLLIGGVGNASIIRRIVNSKDIFTVPSEGLSKKYIVTQIIPILFKFLDEKQLLSDKDEEDDDDEELCSMHCSFIIAHNDKLFYINRRLGVWENSKFCVAGSGGAFAFPYLSAFDDCGDVNGQLLNAMRGSAKHDAAVSGPYVFIDSRNLVYTIKES